MSAGHAVAIARDRNDLKNSDMITTAIHLVINPGEASFVAGDEIKTGTNVAAPAENRMTTLITGYRSTHVSEGEGDGNLLASGSSKLVIDKPSLTLQELEPTPANWEYFGCELIKNGDRVVMNSPHKIYLTETEVGVDYAVNFLQEKAYGGGAFIERHDNQHWHNPLSEKCGGYYLVGKTHGNVDGQDDKYRIEVGAMKIPYGYGVKTGAYVWHCDAFLTGKWKVAYGDTPDSLTMKIYENVDEPAEIRINTLEKEELVLLKTAVVKTLRRKQGQDQEQMRSMMKTMRITTKNMEDAAQMSGVPRLTYSKKGTGRYDHLK